MVEKRWTSFMDVPIGIRLAYLSRMRERPRKALIRSFRFFGFPTQVPFGTSKHHCG